MQVLSNLETTMVTGAGNANLLEVAQDALKIGAAASAAAFLAALIIPEGDAKLHEQASGVMGVAAVSVFGRIAGGAQKADQGYNYIQKAFSGF